MMKLSEAIRLGSMIRPQAFGSIKTHPGSGRRAATCALGAGLEAIKARVKVSIGRKGQFDTRGKPLEGRTVYTWNWPAELRPIVYALAEYPCLCGISHPSLTAHVQTIIPHLNDVHRWTRQQIADWVEMVEAKHHERQALRAQLDQSLSIKIPQ